MEQNIFGKIAAAMAVGERLTINLEDIIKDFPATKHSTGYDTPLTPLEACKAADLRLVELTNVGWVVEKVMR